jgi:hypothetical protein
VKRLVPLRPLLESVSQHHEFCTSCVTAGKPSSHCPVSLVRPWLFTCAAKCLPLLFQQSGHPSVQILRPAVLFISRPTGRSLVVHLCTSLSGAILCIQRCPSIAAVHHGRWTKPHIAPAPSYISFCRLGLAVFIYRNCATSAKIATDVSFSFSSALCSSVTRCHLPSGPSLPLDKDVDAAVLCALHRCCEFGAVFGETRR